MGYASRANRQRRYGRLMDEQECRRVAESLKASLAHFGLRLSPTASVSRMIAVAEKAATEGVLASQDEEQVWLLGQAQHVASCLERFRGVQDTAGVLPWIKRSLDRIDEPGSKGLDRLLEVEIAGRLAELEITVTTTEPDVVAVIPGENPVGFACKHPDTLSGVRERVREAAKQIAKSGHPGVVVMSLDSVFHQAGRHLAVRQARDASVWGVERLEEVLRDCSAEIQRALETTPSIVGIVLLLSVPYLASGPPRTIGFQKVAKIVPGWAREPATTILSLLARLFLEQ